MNHSQGTGYFPIYHWLFLDPGQCEGLKGSSISHYLVRLLHFVHSYLDKNEPYAVLLSLVHLKIAFNRVSHTIVIEDLADLNVPGWLLKILISYLTDRSMVLYPQRSFYLVHLHKMLSWEYSFLILFDQIWGLFGTFLDPLGYFLALFGYFVGPNQVLKHF